jgi:hypothetical protein
LFPDHHSVMSGSTQSPAGPSPASAVATAAATPAFTPALQKGVEYYHPVYEPDFPRTEYKRLASYSNPLNRPHSRVLWAARDASTEWTRAFAKQDWDAIDEATVRLVVFDKAYEM